MKKANLPIETAHEPEEEAHQPSSKIMPPVQINEEERSDINDSEKSEFQSSSINGILSQLPPGLSQRERLQWLQKKRTVGLWVQCDDCDRWRYLPDVLDSHELPNKWYCSMNPDTSVNRCSAPESPIELRSAEDLIHSAYAAGSLVAARARGWPWWPAMVDDCPDTEQYYWLDGFSDIPTHYNVVFFDSSEVTRAWLPPSQLKPYSQTKDLIKSALKTKSYRKRLEVAISQANDAENLSLEARLKKYSFITRYKGIIASPKKINVKLLKKFQNQFKRKFNIDLPEEFSDSDSEMSPTQKHKNMIVLGNKKKKNGGNSKTQ
ncbi:unnamed protein product, partial [Brenthis ino]